MQSERFFGAAVFLLLLVGAARNSAAADPPPTPPAFRDFTQRVQEYLKLQKAVPRLRTTKNTKEITDRRHALALNIKEKRSDAKPGDLFTPEVTEELRGVIRSVFQGPNAANVRKTVRQPEPLDGVHLAVNADYPERLPWTTVPPTLLRRLPQLPDGVAYRIIGHNFVLEDTEARLIVDFIPGIIP